MQVSIREAALPVALRVLQLGWAVTGTGLDYAGHDSLAMLLEPSDDGSIRPGDMSIIQGGHEEEIPFRNNASVQFDLTD
jgi:hypothetical protein